MAEHVEQHPALGAFGEGERSRRLIGLRQQAHHLAIGVGLALEGALAVLFEAGGAVAQRLDAGDRSFEGGARLVAIAQPAPGPAGRQLGGPDPRLLPGGETDLGGAGGRVERFPVLAPGVAHVGEPQQRVGERTPLAEFVEQDDAALVLRERPVEVALGLIHRPELELGVGDAGAVAGGAPQLERPSEQRLGRGVFAARGVETGAEVDDPGDADGVFELLVQLLGPGVIAQRDGVVALHAVEEPEVAERARGVDPIADGVGGRQALEEGVERLIVAAEILVDHAQVAQRVGGARPVAEAQVDWVAALEEGGRPIVVAALALGHRQVVQACGPAAARRRPVRPARSPLRSGPRRSRSCRAGVRPSPRS